MATKTKNKKPAAPARRKAPGAGKPDAPPVTGARLAAVKKKLLEMRADLDRSVRRQGEVDNNDNGDSVDQAQMSIEKELLFELSDNERVTLDQIEAALRKIEKGTYGLCESCQKAIAKPRLDALPFARYCISCQSSSESVTEFAPEAPDFRGIEEAGSKDLNA